MARDPGTSSEEEGLAGVSGATRPSQRRGRAPWGDDSEIRFDDWLPSLIVPSGRLEWLEREGKGDPVGRPPARSCPPGVEPDG